MECRINIKESAFTASAIIFFFSNNAREMRVISLRRGKVYMGERQKAHSQLHPTHTHTHTNLIT
jgi:hypothetical protein